MTLWGVKVQLAGRIESSIKMSRSKTVTLLSSHPSEFVAHVAQINQTIFKYDPRCPSFEKGLYADQVKAEGKKVASCSSMQLNDGLKHGQKTYLVVMLEIKEGVFQEVPNKVAIVLEEFSDVMPASCPSSCLPDEP